jgi:hypothetical protein
LRANGFQVRAADPRRATGAEVAAQLESTGPRYGAIATIDNMAWTVGEKNFATMTMTPSFDASRAGHWHGFITNGELR